MNLRIKRRRFAQLVITSAASAAIANFANKSLAQQPPLIYGVRLASQKQNRLAAAVTDLANTTPAMVLAASDLRTGQALSTFEIPEQIIDNPQEESLMESQAISLAPRERITGLTVQLDGTFIISTVVHTKKGNFSRLLFTDGRSPKARKVSGFKKSKHLIESILAVPLGSRQDYQLLSVFSLNDGTPPFDLGTIDPKTGKVRFGAELALPELQQNRRYSNLALSPDGTIYATTLDSEGATTLVKLDSVNKGIVTGRGKIIQLSQLRFNNQPLANDLLSLAVSPSGQLFALADPNREGTNSLFTVDVKTGEMQFLRRFEADLITFALA